MWGYSSLLLARLCLSGVLYVTELCHPSLLGCCVSLPTTSALTCWVFPSTNQALLVWAKVTCLHPVNDQNHLSPWPNHLEHSPMCTHHAVSSIPHTGIFISRLVPNFYSHQGPCRLFKPNSRSHCRWARWPSPLSTPPPSQLVVPPPAGTLAGTRETPRFRPFPQSLTCK